MEKTVELVFIKKIKDSKKKHVFTAKAFICTTPFSKFLGLMFSKKKNLVFVFRKEQRTGIHMFFVFFPIWVFFLDSKKNVVEKAYLKPFSFYMPRKKAKFLVEISKDFEKIPNFKENDKIIFKMKK